MATKRPQQMPSDRLSTLWFLLLICIIIIQTIHAFTAPFRLYSLQNHCRHSHRLEPLRAHKYLATCLPGLASIVEQELRQIEGAYNIETSGTAAVHFEGDSPKVGLDALLWTRATMKLMEHIASSSPRGVESRQDVYDFIQDSVNVKQLLGDGKGGLLTLSVHVVFTNARDVPSDINHSHYTALTIKNALVDMVREFKDGDRPSVDVQAANVPLVAVIRGAGPQTTMSLYKQLHNGSLHRRGYRRGSSIHKASMKESMAAGLLLATGTNFTSATKLTLVDPMAGSGSLLVEGAMMLADIAPGLMRIKCGEMATDGMPPVVTWKHEDSVKDIWKQLLSDATQRAKRGVQRLRSNPDICIVANDVHAGALDLLEESLHQAGLSNVVEVHQGDCQDFCPPNTGENCLVVTNPPWGIRLNDDMHQSWEALRVFLRQNCRSGTTAWVLSGNKEATKHLGLRRSQSMVLQTGQQDLRWIQYKILDKSARQAEQHDDSIAEVRKPRQQEQTRLEQPKRYTPRQSSRSDAANKPSRGGYERRNQQRENSVTKPLSTAEREERKNSWYI